MANISKKWDLNRIPQNWIFTKTHANGVYKNAISKSRTFISQLSPGASSDFIRTKIKGDWFYWVASYIGNHDRFTFTKDLWSSYGFKVHGTQNGDIYVRRK